MKYSLLILSVCLMLLSFGQSTAQDKKKKPSEDAYVLLEAAKKYMASGDFEKANLTFRRMLKLKTVLPTELSYLFAETLFQVGQYDNSINFLEKYQNLTDRGSDYYLQSVELEKQLTSKLEAIKQCQLCNHAGYRYFDCSRCKAKGTFVQECHQCRGHGLLTCPTCTGNGVVISTNQFNEKDYRTCEKCNSKGFISCPICEGKKEIEAICPQCNGTGRQAGSEICN